MNVPDASSDGTDRGRLAARSGWPAWAGGGRERARYLLAVSRPRFWFYLAGPVLVGLAWGAPDLGSVLTPVTIALFAYFLVPANVFLYGLNDYFDRDLDRLNPKKVGPGESPTGVSAPESGRGDGAIVVRSDGECAATPDRVPEVQYRGDRVVPAMVAIAAGIAVGFAWLLPGVALAWIGIFLVLGTAYSAPPVRLKTVPVLDSVSNGLYLAPGAAAYAAVAGVNPPLAAIVGGWLWAMGMHTYSAIPDIAPDRAAGIATTATVLGPRRTLAYCGACWILAAGSFGWIHPALALAFLPYPILVAVVALRELDVERVYWWFPALNTLAGAALTIGGLWVIAGG